MFDYRTVEAGIIVDCSSLHFGPFSVLIISEGEKEYTFYLRHKKYCILKYMFSICATENDTITDLVEIAENNAPQYIPDFIQECFADNE